MCNVCMEATIHILSSGGTLSKLDALAPPRHWRTLKVLGSVGRFCPDTELKPQAPLDGYQVAPSLCLRLLKHRWKVKRQWIEVLLLEGQ